MAVGAPLEATEASQWTSCGTKRFTLRGGNLLSHLSTRRSSDIKRLQWRRASGHLARAQYNRYRCCQVRPSSNHNLLCTIQCVCVTFQWSTSGYMIRDTKCSQVQRLLPCLSKPFINFQGTLYQPSCRQGAPPDSGTQGCALQGRWTGGPPILSKLLSRPLHHILEMTQLSHHPMNTCRG